MVAADADNNTAVEHADCCIAENAASVEAYLLVEENGTRVGSCALDSDIELCNVAAGSTDFEVINLLAAE